MPEEKSDIIQFVQEAVQVGARKERCCEVLSLSLRTLQRWEKDPQKEDLRGLAREGQRKGAPGLSEEEKQAMLKIVHSLEYQNLSPHQIVVKLADLGQYIASERSFYRLLRSKGLLAHRGRSRPKTHARPRELLATGPNEVYSWDITYLLSPVKGQYYYLYLVMDVWSRLIVGSRVEEVESSEYAAELIHQCCQEQRIEKGQLHLHSDNGAPMKGATFLATLQWLGIEPSFSRPGVSDDNPYSESLFRTLKYSMEYPTKPFLSLVVSRSWVTRFVSWYNHEHLHSKIKFVTPYSRHHGEDQSILEERVKVYEAAQARNPGRWSGAIRDWTKPKLVFLNPSKKKRGSQTLHCVK